MTAHSDENDWSADECGYMRGTVAEAVNFAAGIAEDLGVRMVARVDERRAELPPIVEHRVDHDGPTWTVRPAGHLTRPGSTGADQ